MFQLDKCVFNTPPPPPLFDRDDKLLRKWQFLLKYFTGLCGQIDKSSSSSSFYSSSFSVEPVFTERQKPSRCAFHATVSHGDCCHSTLQNLRSWCSITHRAHISTAESSNHTNLVMLMLHSGNVHLYSNRKTQLSLQGRRDGVVCTWLHIRRHKVLIWQPKFSRRQQCQHPSRRLLCVVTPRTVVVGY